MSHHAFVHALRNIAVGLAITVGCIFLAVLIVSALLAWRGRVRGVDPVADEFEPRGFAVEREHLS